MAELGIGLQEWASCCRALGDGRLVLAVRKGGIHEHGGGLFRPEQERFLLMPTYLHQDQTRIQPPFIADLEATRSDPAPGVHRISLWAEVACVWKVTDLPALQSLGPELLWTPQELETRFAYRGQPWLFALALRVMRLPTPVDLPDEPSYAGCRSWIPLKRSVTLDNSVPVIASGWFETRLERIDSVLSPSRTDSSTTSGSRTIRTPLC